MTDFDTLRVKMGRRPITVVELDLDFCENVYGQSPCTANGTTKCYNTFKTCQDTGNFRKKIKTYRLTTENAFLPVGEQIFPCIKDVSIAPTKLEMKGLSLRANVTITCYDFPYHDRGLDPYWSERGEPKGTFFGKLTRRNPYVVNRPICVITAYIDDNRMVWGEAHHYFIESIDGPDSNGRVVIKAKDILKLADSDTAKAPSISNGKLTADIAADAPIVPLYPTGIVNEYDDEGYVRIGDEVIAYTGKTQNGLTGLTRGALGTLAVEHSADDKVQQCLRYERQSVEDILLDLLMNYANVDGAYIPIFDWREEAVTWLGLNKLSGLITEPTGVNKLIEELLESTASLLWWDEIAKLIRFRVVAPPLPDNVPIELSDTNNLLKGSVKIVSKEADRITRASVYTSLTQASFDVKKENFARVNIAINSDMESEFAHGEIKEREVLSRWIQSEPIAEDVAGRLLDRFQDAPKEITFQLDARETLKTGDYADITARLTPEDDGSSGAVRVLITERKEAKQGSHIQYVGYQTGEPGTVANVFAPDDAPDSDDGDPEDGYMYFTGDDGLIDGEGIGGKLC